MKHKQEKVNYEKHEKRKRWKMFYSTNSKLVQALEKGADVINLHMFAG